jgi:hypothetical protein
VQDFARPGAAAAIVPGKSISKSTSIAATDPRTVERLERSAHTFPYAPAFATRPNRAVSTLSCLYPTLGDLTLRRETAQYEPVSQLRAGTLKRYDRPKLCMIMAEMSSTWSWQSSSRTARKVGRVVVVVVGSSAARMECKSRHVMVLEIVSSSGIESRVDAEVASGWGCARRKRAP